MLKWPRVSSVGITNGVFCNVIDGWKILPNSIMKPEGFAEHHQILSSWVGSGDETKKRIDLDHVYHVTEYAKLRFPH